MTDPGTDLGYEARFQVRRALREMAKHPGAADEPRPQEALAALVALRAAVTQAERDATRRAREEGKTWSDIGEALGFADDPGPGMTSVAERAFHYLASDLGSGPSFAWTCPACGELVSDGGPEMPLDDAERGHAEGCERFAEAVRAWDAQWEG